MKSCHLVAVPILFSFLSSVIIDDRVSGAIWEKARAQLVSKQSQRRVNILK